MINLFHIERLVWARSNFGVDHLSSESPCILAGSENRLSSIFGFREQDVSIPRQGNLYAVELKLVLKFLKWHCRNR